MNDPQARVFVVQERRKMRFESAQVYGKLVFVFDEFEQVYDPDLAIAEASKVLADFSDRDYIVPVGSPLAIAICTTIASSKNGGRVKLLNFVKDVQSYVQAQFDFSGVVPEDTHL